MEHGNHVGDMDPARITFYGYGHSISAMAEQARLEHLVNREASSTPNGNGVIEEHGPIHRELEFQSYLVAGKMDPGHKDPRSMG